ncbi:hypothetical protein GGI20_000258 [Coemansia sp. BCRC 34301]|nr:hypothetical protein GGI20_000258 [Coemansia sp. BCRC 34301]
MNNTTPNTRNSNNAANQPLATQQPTTTEKIKDSVKQTVTKVQSALTGSHTKTMTPPSSNDAAHVLGSNNVDSHHRHTQDKTSMGAAYESSKNAAENKAAGNIIGVHAANDALDRKRNEGITGKAAGAAGNIVGKVEGTTERVTSIHNSHQNDAQGATAGKHGVHSLSNDVGCGTASHQYSAHCASGHNQQESRLNQQIDAPWQQISAVPPQQQPKLGGQIPGNNTFDNTERPSNVAGNNAFDNTRPGNPNQLSSNPVPPNKVSATNRADEARRF